MSAEPDLVSLLYRADWTQLTLSAVSNHGTSVLVAPGRRYRVQAAGSLTGCDGDRPWRLGWDWSRDCAWGWNWGQDCDRGSGRGRGWGRSDQCDCRCSRRQPQMLMLKEPTQ